jgi:hypothetical protein
MVGSVSPVTRPLVAALSLVGLWFLAMVLETLRAPVWALVVNGALLLVNVIALAALIHQATREQDRRDGDGGIRAIDRGSPESGGGPGPSWWPELERELAEYLAEHEQDDREPQRVPVGHGRTTEPESAPLS